MAAREALRFIRILLPGILIMANSEAHALTQTITSADGARMTFAIENETLRIDYHAGRPAHDWARTVFIAIGTAPHKGSPVIPFAADREGSTVFLPFPANRLYAARLGTDSVEKWQRRWNKWSWNDEEQLGEDLQIEVGASEATFRMPVKSLGTTGKLPMVIYSKDFSGGRDWGEMSGCSDPAVTGGGGDKYIPHYLELSLRPGESPLVVSKGRLGTGISRVQIYQLFVRLFGNVNQTRKPNGNLSENGVGKFDDINPEAISSIKEMGFTHVWLTGVLQQATATDYSDIGQPADDPDLLKGLAGSPYAVKDYFDVCPDYARNPANRLLEFKSLLERLHAAGLKAFIDIVPNHVARSYASDVKPEQAFGSKGQAGKGDDRTKFFDAGNNFFYLQPDNHGPPLRLPTYKDGQPVSPTCKVSMEKCDGLFAGEKDFGRVTGNNVASWTPGLGDWYETVKLNYGFDFSDNSKKTRAYPHAGAPDKAVPDTWNKMDAVFAYWQAVGVDGFRCDMSHMIPPEFWSWVIARARGRNPDVFFSAEAYDDDPAKLPGSNPVVAGLNGGRGNISFDLLNAGFNAVYDAPAYRALKKIYEGPGWANDIDASAADEFIFHNSLRYAENHDEVRLAAPHEWGGVGMDVGRPVAAILYGMSRGATMLYNGQEVGEPAAGAEGFGGDDSRTSIFDYWSMPELVKWVNHHKYDGANLSAQQTSLRQFYGRLLRVTREPAFGDGSFYSLNRANHDLPKFGRLPNEPASGHWLYAFLRYDAQSGQRILAVVNLHPSETLHDVAVTIPTGAMTFLGLGKTDAKTPLTFTDRLAANDPLVATSCINEASSRGVWIGDIPPLTPFFLEVKTFAEPSD